jgi:hypothetical protein
MFGSTKVAAIAAAMFLVSLCASGADDKLTAEDILKHHLDSIGDAATRAALKSRVVEGAVSYQVMTGGSSIYTGNGVLVSEGQKFHMLLKINAPQYTGERFISNGGKISVEGTYPNKARSALGTRFYDEELPLREGLVGGVLNTAWPLLQLDAYKGRLQYEGLRNFGGKDLHVVAYKPNKNSDVRVTLYFEPGTFRHLATVYSETKSPDLAATRRPLDPPVVHGSATRVPGTLGSSPDALSARRAPNYWTIEEQFGDFKTVDGLTLPAHYNLRFEQRLGNNPPSIIQWDMSTTRVLNNVSVDDRNFAVQ